MTKDSLINDLVYQKGAIEHSVMYVHGAIVEAYLEMRRWNQVKNMQIYYATQQTLNVQRLMFYMRIFDTLKLASMIPPPEKSETVTSLPHVPFDIEELRYKGVLLQKELEQEATLRRESVREIAEPELIRPLRLYPTAINLTDQTAYAMLESYLWTLNPTAVMQTLETIYEACVRKQLHVEEIVGQQPLQKLLMQMLITMYMEFPSVMNMISMRVSPLTMLVLQGKAGQLYRVVSGQKQAHAVKAWAEAVQRRKTQTKALTSYGSGGKPYPTKTQIAVTENLQDDTKVALRKDLTGKDMAILGMALARGIPYYMKRAFARSLGVPERSPLFRKPFISMIPVRRTLYSRRRSRYTAEGIVRFNRDEYLRLMKKYGSRHGYS